MFSFPQRCSYAISAALGGSVTPEADAFKAKMPSVAALAAAASSAALAGSGGAVGTHPSAASGGVRSHLEAAATPTTLSRPETALAPPLPDITVGN